MTKNMAFNSSSSMDFTYSNAPSIHPHLFNPEPYLLTEALIFNDHADSYYQIPVESGKLSTKNDIPCPSDPRFRQEVDINAPLTNSTCRTYHERDDLEAPRSKVTTTITTKGNTRGKRSSEESARKRREQNRTSQRTCRARRGRYIEELERRNQLLQRHASVLLEENERLKLQLEQSQLSAAQNNTDTTTAIKDPATTSTTTTATTATTTACSTGAASSSTCTIMSSPSSPAQPQPQPAAPSTSTHHNSNNNNNNNNGEYLDFKGTLDLIHNHWLYKCGHVRIEDIYQQLKEGAGGIIRLDGIRKRVDVLNAIQCCPIGRQ